MVVCMANVRRLSCDMFTCKYGVDDDGIIVESAPIIKRFLGQPESNLIKWASAKSKSFVVHIKNELKVVEGDVTYCFTTLYESSNKY